MRDSSFTLNVPTFLMRRSAAARAAGFTDPTTPAEAEALHATLDVVRQVVGVALLELQDIERQLPPEMRTTEAWFALLSRYPAGESLPALDRLGRAIGAEGSARLARFGLFKAALVACDHLSALKLAPTVKMLFCETLVGLTRPKPQWAPFFEIGHIRFEEIARVVTLRRFPAGQHHWNISRFPVSWLPRLRPRDLPRFLREILALRGRPPMAVTHLNYMRPNALVILNGEARKSYHRIARSIELHPEVRGILTYSWFYCSSVKEVTPHLAWLREFFVENGAAAFEMEPAPESSGFTIGSRRRQQLHASGQFRPRMTMVIWRRRELLAWAEANQHLAAEDTRVQIPGIESHARANGGADR